MSLDYRKAAQGVMDNIGGASNVASAAHCATRLRLVINDNSKVNTAAIENVEGVKGCFEASGQLQIIFGTGTVNKVFDEFIAISGVEAGTKESAKEAAAQKQNPFFRAIKTLGDVFVPIIPAIVASGLLNGLLGGLSNAIPSLQNSSYYNMINLMAGAALSMLPILIAISAAKKFGGNPYLAAVIGFVMIHPNLINAWSVATMDAAKIPVWNVFGLTIQQTGYQGHVIPVIIAILFMSTLEKWLHKHVPEILDLFVTPLVTVLVTGILTMTIIGPVFKVVEDWILIGARTIITLPFGVGGLLIGFFYAFTVVAGFHHMYNMIEAQMVSQNPPANIWMPVATAANVGQGAAAMAVAFKTKNEKTKSMALPASLSAFLGITEPAIFGVNIRYRKPFIAGCCGGAVGGMLASLFGIKATAYGITGLFGFLITTDFWLQYAIVMAVSFVVAFAVSYISYKDETPAQAAPVVEKAEIPAGQKPAETAEEPAKEGADGQEKKVYAPINGEAIPSAQVDDPTFASEALGKGLAIIPSEGKVYAPFDGTVEMLFDTKHVVAVTSDDGVEVLIHVGVDTVNLKGEGYTAHTATGEKVKKGQLLLEFDMDRIKKAGYQTVTPVIVTNSDEYKNVRVVKTGSVRAGDEVLTVC
ncbi:MAG: glucose PTS transporter subunit IIA [Lachnospiraceae bacterium]|nr:glucose PTS transporter subunit IIA [Lachnospiraceae bacterium]MDD7048948.1 glucose PTS transporter subunit IIA [Lachnospiraceae bacterium]